MTLSEFLFLKNKTRAEFAAEIGVTPEAVRLWLEGERTPTPRMMRKIVEATGNKVSPNDFFMSGQSSKGRAA